MIKTSEKQKINDLADRLEYFNEWRRGENCEMPPPKTIGKDIDSAIKIIRELEKI